MGAHWSKYRARRTDAGYAGCWGGRWIRLPGLWTIRMAKTAGCYGLSGAGASAVTSEACPASAASVLTPRPAGRWRPGVWRVTAYAPWQAAARRQFPDRVGGITVGLFRVPVRAGHRPGAGHGSLGHGVAAGTGASRGVGVWLCIRLVEGQGRGSGRAAFAGCRVREQHGVGLGRAVGELSPCYKGWAWKRLGSEEGLWQEVVQWQ
jgi:hypothetical protein